MSITTANLENIVLSVGNPNIKMTFS